MSTNIKAGIFILTQNTIERKVYLKTCLYFLFRNFNQKFKYPIIILHEGDYDKPSQEEIILSIRQSFRQLISFKQIDKEDFEVPPHIDVAKVNKIIDIKAVPYWRNLRYRLMCYFWLKQFFKYTKDFDYVMRLDDDSIIEEPIKDDLFSIVSSRNLVYMSNIVHIDCGLCNYGMKELFCKLLPECKEKLDAGMFIQAKVSPTSEYFSKFKQIRDIVENRDTGCDEFIAEMPIMYYNNFFITSTAFWQQEKIKDLIDKIDAHGGIFYYRYGDAPIHTLIVSLLASDKISRAQFKYSKRLQREVFIDDNNNFHCYMPKTYDKSSCITDN